MCTSLEKIKVIDLENLNKLIIFSPCRPGIKNTNNIDTESGKKKKMTSCKYGRFK